MDAQKIIRTLLIFGGTVLLLVACSQPQPEMPASSPTDTPPPAATNTPPPEPAPTPVSEIDGDTEAGQQLYAEACAPCHGQDATGIEGIGLDLTASDFVGALDNPQLADFLVEGRTLDSPFNQTGISMPPNGGRADLTGDDMLNIATYLRSINTKEGATSAEAAGWLDSKNGEQAEESQTAEASVALSEGQTIYLRYCAVCHGAQGEGVESLGKGLTSNEFMAPLTNEQLADFIAAGRNATDPLNSTGIEMLPYGGQTPFSNTEMEALLVYLREMSAVESAAVARPSDVEDDSAAEAEQPESLPEMSPEEFEQLKTDAFSIMLRSRPKCFTCHHIVERGNKSGPGPFLDNMGALAAERVPGQSAAEYLEEAILNPGSFIVSECPSGPCVDAMPEYSDQLEGEKLETLITYLLLLKE